MYSQEEIKTARKVAEEIIKGDNQELKSIYTAGEIVAFAEQQQKIDKLLNGNSDPKAVKPKSDPILAGGAPSKEHTNYPSRYALGEKVELNFELSGKLTQPCEIHAVKFDNGKVWYDISIRAICAAKTEEDTWTVIKDVDSFFVKDFKDPNI